LGATRAFRLTLNPLNVEDLGSLGGDFSAANGINENGDVTGHYHDVDGQTRAFAYYGNGPMMDIGDLGGAGTQTIAWSINNSGQIFGLSNQHAFRYTPGVGGVGMEQLGSNKKGMYSGDHINDAGQVVGSINPKRFVHHAARFTDGVSVKDLGTLGGDGTDGASGINFFGDVVGLASTPNTRHGFLYTDELDMIDLDLAVVNVPIEYFGILRPTNINDFGDICGSTDYSTGLPQRAFLLTPLP
jgi:probable HAF family extracellular repeat protein